MAKTQENPARFYTVKELAELWHLKDADTVHGFLLRMRRDGRGPSAEQITERRLSATKSKLLIRADYALVLQAVFVTKTQPMPRKFRDYYGSGASS